MNAEINAEVETKDLELASQILNRIGLDLETYLRMAIIELINKEAIPFELDN